MSAKGKAENGKQVPFFTRALAKAMPAMAARRVRGMRQFEAESNSFAGGRSAYQRDNPAFINSFPGSEDDTISPYNQTKLVVNIRDMRRNLGIVFGALDRFADGVVGTGLIAMPNTSDTAWNKQTGEFWEMYMGNCDHRRRLHGEEIQRLAIKMRMAERESGLVKRPNGQINPMESERMLTPEKLKSQEGKTIWNGFVVNEEEQVTGVHIAKRKRGQANPRDTQLIPIEEFIHVTTYDRYDQIRGNVGIASITDFLRDKGELQIATLYKAKVDAFMGWAVTSEDDRTENEMTVRGITTDDIEKTGAGIRLEKWAQSQILTMPKGSEVKSLEGKTPNAQFDKFNETLLREIAMAMGIPWQVLMLDMAKASFSGGHGMLNMARKTWSIWRRWLVREMMAPWYQWRVGMAIIDGVLPEAPVDAMGLSEWHKVKWQPPEQLVWDPKGAATANATALQSGTTSLPRLVRAEGGEYAQIVDETEGALDLQIEAAGRLNEKHKDEVGFVPVTRFEFSLTTPPGGVPVAPVESEPKPEPSDGGDDDES